MNIEFLIVEHEGLGEPVAFIKKPNKIYLKKSRGKEKSLETLVFDCLSLAKHFKNAILNINMSVSEELSEKIKLNQGVDFKNSVSETLRAHSEKALSEINNPTEDKVEAYLLEEKGQIFIILSVKAGIRQYSVIRHKRLSETPVKLFKRMISSLLAKEKFSDDLKVFVSQEEMKLWFSEFMYFNEKTVEVMGENRTKEMFLKYNKDLIENKMKSSQKNELLKKKYMVNEEDVKRYSNSLVIYTDGAVFPDKSCGVGVVVTKNEKMLKSFSVKVGDCIPDSNECEYRGIKEALKHVVENKINAEYIEIRTDSLNCARRIDEGNVCNIFTGLIGKIKSNVAVKWNKGHAGIEFNEMADLLAKTA